MSICLNKRNILIFASFILVGAFLFYFTSLLVKNNTVVETPIEMEGGLSAGNNTIFSSREEDEPENTLYETINQNEGNEALYIPSEFGHVAPITIGVHARHEEDVVEFENRTGASVDIVAVHIHWGNEHDFPMIFASQVRDRGATLMIFWNPMDYREGVGGQSEFYYRHILNGVWDEYIDIFVSAVGAYGGKVIIAPLEEVNGEWTHWSGVKGRYGTHEEYLATYRYLREKFRATENVSFAWVINHVSVPEIPNNSIARYYPGDAYVDVIGINAFNFGSPWLDFDDLVKQALEEVLFFKKPLFISSTACAEGDLKPIWIEEFFQSTYFRTGVLTGFVWFNEDKEKNWLIWSDEQSEAMFASQIEKLKKH